MKTRKRRKNKKPKLRCQTCNRVMKLRIFRGRPTVICPRCRTKRLKHQLAIRSPSNIAKNSSLAKVRIPHHLAIQVGATERDLKEMEAISLLPAAPRRLGELAYN